MHRKRLLTIVLLPLVLFALSAAGIIWDGLTDEIAPVDVAVVMGSKVETDGRPSARLQARLDKAVELYQQGLFANLIVSGGTGRTGHNEAIAMRQYLMKQGIPSEHILVDSDGDNTYWTARNTATLMQREKWQSALIVSQYFHVPRTKLAFNRVGVGRLYSAHADYFELRDLYATAREVVAFYVYLVRSYS